MIFNTFSITVAQRMRELALLRTLGASRGSLLRAVVGEGLIVAVTASAVGIAAGLGFARLLNGVFQAVGVGLPTNDPELRPRTILAAALVGVGVTPAAVLGPALRATRIPPVAALREGAVLPAGRLARLRPVVAGLAVLGGGLLLVRGITSGASVGSRLPTRRAARRSSSSPSRRRPDTPCAPSAPRSACRLAWPPRAAGWRARTWPATRAAPR